MDSGKRFKAFTILTVTSRFDVTVVDQPRNVAKEEHCQVVNVRCILNTRCKLEGKYSLESTDPRESEIRAPPQPLPYLMPIPPTRVL